MKPPLRIKNFALLLLKIFVALLFLAVLSFKVDWRETYIYFRSISLLGLGFCFFLSLLTVFVGAYKWQALLPNYPLMCLLKFNFISQFYSVLFSGQLSGEVIKTYWLGKSHNDTERIAASVFIDKAVGCVALLVMAFLGVLFSSKEVSPLIFLNLFILIFSVFVWLALARSDSSYRFILKCIAGLKKRFLWLGGFLNFIENFLEHWKVYSQNIRILLKIFVLGIAYQALGIFILYCLSQSLNIQISYWDWCWILTVLAGALLFPVTIAGIGVREMTLVGILGIFGVLPEKASALSVSFFLTQLIPAFVGGILQFKKESHIKNGDTYQ